MSRPYRIVVRKVIEHEVSAGDTSTLRLDLDAAAPGADVERILAEVLERNGWREVSPGVYEKERGDGEAMSCDLAERRVTTTIQLDRKVSEEVRRELRGDTWNFAEGREMTAAELAEVRRRATEQLEGRLSAEQKQRAGDALQREATQRLTEGEADRRREINRVILEVMAESLKEKAASLGNVEQMDEEWRGADYELTIQVRE